MKLKRVPKVILLIGSSRSYGRGLLRGIANYSHLHGPWSFYSEPGVQHSNISHLSDWGAEGVIAEVSDPKQISTIAFDIPAVLIPLNQPVCNYVNVMGDWFEEGQMAASYLIERGFKSLAFFGFKDMYWSQKRGEGFADVASKAGLRTHTYNSSVFQLRHKKKWNKELGSLTKYLTSLPKPTGIFACNDDRGRHILEACRLEGIAVPEEIAVIGIDNDEAVCGLTFPPLSSIVVNTEKAGFDAACLLEKMMKGKKHTSQNVMIRATHIVTRQSSDVLAVSDADISKAMRFIRDTAPRKAIQVLDVMEAVGMSRSILETRFRRALKRSVHDEITRVRIDTLAKLLVGTDYSISQIAEQMGFADIYHVSRYFRRKKNMSPVEYRKRYK